MFGSNCMMSTKLGESVCVYLTVFQMVITFLWICVEKGDKRGEIKKPPQDILRWPLIIVKAN
ncbi:hypothetical protein BKI52_39035 [marine bacterium AO1-C]|nr:hypothetical protein BKI52_39035 [marine bacterium AO1-C]